MSRALRVLGRLEYGDDLICFSLLSRGKQLFLEVL